MIATLPFYPSYYMLTPGAYLYKYEQNLGLKSVTGEPVPSERHISSVVNKEINANPLSNT